MAEHSGEGTDGGEGDESSEEETAEDKAFIDDEPVPKRSSRLPKLTAEEKEVSCDELQNLRDTCMELCGESKRRVRRDKQAYADPDDLDQATLSDKEFLASSSDEDDQELKQTELKVGRAIGSYLQSQGVKKAAHKPAAPPALKGPSSLSAEAHKEARKTAFERTMSVLKGLYGQAAPAAASQPAGRVRRTEESRQPAPIFALSRLRGKPAASEPPKRGAPGLILNPVTKEVSYRHPDGRLSPRHGAL